MSLNPQVTMKPVAELHPYQNNPRTHTRDQIAKVVRSIREFGWTNPILLDRDGMAVVGGLAFSQLVTLYVTPVFYTYFDGLQRRAERRFGHPEA